MAALRAAAEAAGVLHRRLTLRWWELGVLAMTMGWRTEDQMVSVRLRAALASRSNGLRHWRAKPGLQCAACMHARLYAAPCWSHAMCSRTIRAVRDCAMIGLFVRTGGACR